MKKTALAIFLIACLFSPFSLRADYTFQVDNPLESQTLGEITEGIVNFIFNISLVLAPLMILVAAFFIITAAGDIAKITLARKIVLWTVIGFAVVLLSKAITSLVAGLFK